MGRKHLKPGHHLWRHCGVDVKVPWELARMQHLPHLALAFGLSQDQGLKEVYSQ